LTVKPAVVDDAGATRIAQEVVQKISQDHEYPGQIKVTVIREVRVQEIAK
jgi:ribonuclease Y